MKVKASHLIIEWDDGKMVVINPGEEGELSDDLAATKIEAGHAEEATGDAPKSRAAKASKGKAAKAEADESDEADAAATDEAPPAA